MHLSADMTMKEVDPPSEGRCSSGHDAPPKFARAGPGTTPYPTRFFQVVSEKKPDVNGTYCEPCLIVARAMSNRSNRG